MIAGIIIGIVLAILALILLLPLSLRLRYLDTLTLSFEILCFSFPLYRQGEVDNKKKGKKTSKKKRKEKAKKASAPKKAKTKRGKTRSVIHYIKLAGRILSRIYHRFPNCFTIVIHRFEVITGGKDAADAAIRYGIVSQAAAYVLTMAESLFRMKTKRSSRLSIQPNFMNGDSAIALDFKLSTRILSLLILLFRAWGVYRQVAKELSPTIQPTNEGA